MPTIVATPGAPDANAFVDLDEAAALVDAMPYPGAWPTPTTASATLGGGADGVVTITAADPGADANRFTVAVEAGVGDDQPLTAALAGSDLTVTLGTTGTGGADPAKNAAALVAAAIDALPEFAAAASGTGATAVPVTARKQFAGGDDREDAQARLLIGATDWMVAQLCWTGAPSTPEQALPWPRTGMTDRNGNAIPDDVVPLGVKKTNVMLAVALAKADVTAPSAPAKGIKRLKASSVEIEYRDDAASATGAGPIPANVSAYLVPSWLCPTAPDDAPFMFAIT